MYDTKIKGMKLRPRWDQGLPLSPSPLSIQRRRSQVYSSERRITLSEGLSRDLRTTSRLPSESHIQDQVLAIRFLSTLHPPLWDWVSSGHCCGEVPSLAWELAHAAGVAKKYIYEYRGLKENWQEREKARTSPSVRAAFWGDLGPKGRPKEEGKSLSCLLNFHPQHIGR